MRFRAAKLILQKFILLYNILEYAYTSHTTVELNISFSSTQESTHKEDTEKHLRTEKYYFTEKSHY